MRGAGPGPPRVAGGSCQVWSRTQGCQAVKKGAGQQAPHRPLSPSQTEERRPSHRAIKAKSRLEATSSNLRFYFFFPAHTTLPDLCPSSFPFQEAEGPGIWRLCLETMGPVTTSTADGSVLPGHLALQGTASCSQTPSGLSAEFH